MGKCDNYGLFENYCILDFGQCSRHNELMKDYALSRSWLAKPFLYRFCMFCTYTRPRYQVSVYRTIGPLVLFLMVMCGTWPLASLLCNDINVFIISNNTFESVAWFDHILIYSV